MKTRNKPKTEYLKPHIGIHGSDVPKKVKCSEKFNIVLTDVYLAPAIKVGN